MNEFDTTTALQDLIPDNHCFGCGPANRGGLQIKSYFAEPGTTVCRFQPTAAHSAGPPDVLNGGIIATLIDCHSICTAIAGHYVAEGRALGSGPLIWCVTGSMEIRYNAPAPLAGPVELTARIIDVSGKKTRVSCSLHAGGRECATAVVTALRVPPEWRTNMPNAG